MINKRSERIDKLSLFQKVNLRVFSKYARIYFFFDSFVNRSFESFLLSSKVFPPVRIVQKVSEANILVLHDGIKVNEKNRVLQCYQVLCEPKYVVVLRDFRAKNMLDEDSWLDIEKLFPVDLNISQYSGYKELLSNFQKLTKQII